MQEVIIAGFVFFSITGIYIIVYLTVNDFYLSAKHQIKTAIHRCIETNSPLPLIKCLLNLSKDIKRECSGVKSYGLYDNIIFFLQNNTNNVIAYIKNYFSNPDNIANVFFMHIDAISELLTDLIFGSSYEFIKNMYFVVLHYTKALLFFFKKFIVIIFVKQYGILAKIKYIFFIVFFFLHDLMLTCFYTILYFLQPQVFCVAFVFLLIDLTHFHIKILIDSYLRTTPGDWHLAVRNLYSNKMLLEVYQVQVYKCKFSFVTI